MLALPLGRLTLETLDALSFFVYSSWIPRLCFLVCVSVFSWDFFANTTTLSRFLVLGLFCLVYHPSSQILGGFEVQADITKTEVSVIRSVSKSHIHNFQILFVDFFGVLFFLFLCEVQAVEKCIDSFMY